MRHSSFSHNCVLGLVMNNANLIASLTADEKKAVKLLRALTDYERVRSDVVESLAKKELVRNLPNNKLDFTDLGEAVYDRLVKAPDQGH